MKNITKYILFFTTLLLFTSAYTQQRIEVLSIVGTQIVPGGQDESGTLIDENLSTFWTPFWANGNGEKSRISDITIPQNTSIDNIKVYDYEGVGTLRIFTKSENGAWQQVASYETSKYKSWETIQIDKVASTIRIEQSGNGCRISEIEIYGLGGGIPPPVDSEILMSLIEVSDNSALIRFDSLSPETEYQISVNGENTGSFETNKAPLEPINLPFVIHISVDGLRSDIVKSNLANLSGFRNLVESGSYTFLANTDANYTVTNPNHVSIWSGLTVAEHGAYGNSGNPPAYQGNTIFDEIEKAGGTSGLYVAKNKLLMLLADKSINEKIFDNDQSNANAILAKATQGNLANYTFWHISLTDNVGHQNGWESASYLNAVNQINIWISNLINVISDNTTLIITSDHGGTGTDHTDSNNSLNNTIPVFIYNSSLGKSRDLFKINPSRNFIRNGETGNVGLDILGLSAITGSSLNNDFSLCWDCDTLIILPPDTNVNTLLTFDNFIGTNVLGDDPANVVAPIVGNIRVYQWLKWLQGDVSNANLNASLSDIKFQFSPSEIGVDLDVNYKSFSEAGLTYVTLFESAMWLTGNNKTKLNAVAFKMSEGRDGLDDPNRWKYRAHLAYQFTARYGNTSVPLNTLVVHESNQKKTGLGYIYAYEGPNEADRWWIGRDKADLTPEEFAAMMSAEYDGHMETLSDGGLKFGARTADPTINVSMGGIAFVDFDQLLQTGSIEWFDRLFSWFEQNRTNPNYETYPLEIVNFHDYPNTERKQRNLSGKGLHPEAYGWREKHIAFVQYLRDRVPSKKIQLWNTEFGYDISQDSPQRIEPFGGFNSEQASGFLTIRCFLEIFGVVDLATHFYLRDNGPLDGGIFSSSALTIKPQNYKPRQGYFYFATTKSALKDCIFESVVVRNNNVHVYKLRNKITGKAAYTLHCPTAEGQNFNYQLNVDGGQVQVIKLQDNSMEGAKSNKSATNGMVNISVSEMPTYVLEK